VKKILSFFRNIVISIIISIISTIIVSEIKVNEISFNLVFQKRFIFIFITTLSVIIFFFMISELLRRKGERGIPVRPYTIIRKHIKIISLIIEIHEFQHLFTRACNAIKKHSPSSANFNTIGRYALGTLLERIQIIVELATGANVSVNIKLFISDNSTSRSNITAAKDTYLRTLIRLHSRKEALYIKKNVLEERDNNKKYYVGKERYTKSKNNKPQSLKKWINQTIKPLKEKLENNNTGYLVNSAYLYILGDKQHYFISNNLIKEEKRDLYTGNCTNWKSYYRSKAVFLICPNLKSGKNVDLNEPIGILIVDSKIRHIFETRFFRKLVGYFAHRLYDFLKYYTLPLTDEKHYGKAQA
jgi:hypothetical protein